MSGSISMLGGLCVTSQNDEQVAFGSKRSAEILVSMALAPPRGLARTTLSQRFWPDADELRARKALNNELWRLRESLKGAGADPDVWIGSSHESLVLSSPDNGGPKVDVHRIFDVERRMNAGKSGDFLEEVAELTQLYNGDLTPEIDTDWIESERRRVRNAYLDCLDGAVSFALDVDQHGLAQNLARAILKIEPLQESAHCAIMKLCMHKGNRVEAVRHYREFADRLKDELDLRPSAELEEIMRQCQGDSDARRSWNIVRVGDDRHDEILDRIAGLRGLARDLRHEIGVLEEIIVQEFRH